MYEMKKKDSQMVGFDINGYFVEPTTDTLVYLMNSLEEPDKQKIEEMAERIKIKEKYEMLAKRRSYVVDWFGNDEPSKTSKKRAA